MLKIELIEFCKTIRMFYTNRSSNTFVNGDESQSSDNTFKKTLITIFSLYFAQMWDNFIYNFNVYKFPL